MADAEKPAAGRNFKRHGARYKARRRAADILFEAEARDVDPVAIVEERAAMSRDQRNEIAPISDYTRQIIEGVAPELDRIDEAIAAHLKETWEIERIADIDRAVLRVAVWEMLFNEDVPLATALVEAVEIASEYSTPDSPGYINAILDSMIKNIDALRARPIEEPEPTEASADLLRPEDLDAEGVEADDADAEDAESEEAASEDTESEEAEAATTEDEAPVTVAADNEPEAEAEKTEAEQPGAEKAEVEKTEAEAEPAPESVEAQDSES